MQHTMQRTVASQLTEDLDDKENMRAGRVTPFWYIFTLRSNWFNGPYT